MSVHKAKGMACPRCASTGRYSSLYWIDEWHHVKEEGDKIIEEYMYECHFCYTQVSTFDEIPKGYK